MINPPIIQSILWSTTRAILSSEVSCLRTSSAVHTIGLSSLHLPCLSANFAIHSYNSTWKEKKKILCISVYRYLSNYYSFVNRGFLFSCATNLWIFLSNQSPISFLVGLSVTTIEPFVGLMGPNVGSMLSKQENPYTTSPFSINPWSAD